MDPWQPNGGDVVSRINVPEKHIRTGFAFASVEWQLSFSHLCVDFENNIPQDKTETVIDQQVVRDLRWAGCDDSIVITTSLRRLDNIAGDVHDMQDTLEEYNWVRYNFTMFPTQIKKRI